MCPPSPSPGQIGWMKYYQKYQPREKSLSGFWQCQIFDSLIPKIIPFMSNILQDQDNNGTLVMIGVDGELPIQDLDFLLRQNIKHWVLSTEKYQPSSQTWSLSQVAKVALV